MRHNPATAWVFAVPSKRLEPKQCDQVSEEFRKAGIGICLSGEKWSQLSLSILVNVNHEKNPANINQVTNMLQLLDVLCEFLS